MIHTWAVFQEGLLFVALLMCVYQLIDPCYRDIFLLQSCSSCVYHPILVTEIYSCYRDNIMKHTWEELINELLMKYNYKQLCHNKLILVITERIFTWQETRIINWAAHETPLCHNNNNPLNKYLSYTWDQFI